MQRARQHIPSFMGAYIPPCGDVTGGVVIRVGDKGAATAGVNGAATAGVNGAATAGDNGAATSRGASSVGVNGLCAARGNDVKVRGGMGAVLIIVEENGFNFGIAEWKAAVVDGDKILPDIWYKLVDGEFVKAED